MKGFRLLQATRVSPTKRRRYLCKLIRKQVSLAINEEEERNRHSGKEWEEKHKHFLEKRKSYEQNEYPTGTMEEEETITK